MDRRALCEDYPTTSCAISRKDSFIRKKNIEATPRCSQSKFHLFWLVRGLDKGVNLTNMLFSVHHIAGVMLNRFRPTGLKD